MRENNKSVILLLLTALCVIASCSDGGEDTPTMELAAYVPQYIETDSSRTATRSWPPTGFVSYSTLIGQFSGQTSNDGASIGVFFTKDNMSPPVTGRFRKGSDDRWRTNIEVDPDDYYVYGFVPYEAAQTATVSSADYATGATITLNGLNTVDNKDVCVAVGVKDGSNATTVEGLEEGLFATTIRSGENTNFIFMLFEHIMAGFRFNYSINASYAAVRTIKVKKVELRAFNGSDPVTQRVNATITLAGGAAINNAITSVVFEPVAGSGDSEGTLFNAETEQEHLTLDPTTPTDILGTFPPTTATRFQLVTTYDVYDAASTPNLIRENEQATNTFTAAVFGGGALQAGRIHTLHITVNPTYLYMLSDPDMDNPSFSITE